MKNPQVSTNWSFPCPVLFGPGRVQEIASTVEDIGSKAPLIVTDRGLADHPMCTAITDYLNKAGVTPGLFSDVQPNPTEDNVAQGVKAFKAGGYDAVIALGGGSAIDAAKAVALMAGQSISIWDLEDVGDNWRRADAKAIAPVIAIPTTAGTGSEFGRSSVISNSDECRKVIIFHPKMLPTYVIMDPELTVGLPPFLTAGTGIDALSHALEAWCAPSFHPMADGLAVQAMVMIQSALPAVHKNPDDMHNRGQMLVASGMACLALQKGLGAMHAISHPIGALYDAHHGALNGILMPHVLHANWGVIEPRMANLSTRMGLGGDAQDILDFVNGLLSELELPTSLEVIGVEIEDPTRVAKMALTDPCAQGNPVELTMETVLEILDAAKAGTQCGHVKRF